MQTLGRLAQWLSHLKIAGRRLRDNGSRLLEQNRNDCVDATGKLRYYERSLNANGRRWIIERGKENRRRGLLNRSQRLVRNQDR